MRQDVGVSETSGAPCIPQILCNPDCRSKQLETPNCWKPLLVVSVDWGSISWVSL